MRQGFLFLSVFIAGTVTGWLVHHAVDSGVGNKSGSVVADQQATVPGIESTAGWQPPSTGIQPAARDEATETAGIGREDRRARARQLIDRGRLAEAEAMLDALLIDDHRDVIVLEMFADLELAGNQPGAAISRLYEARGYAYRQEDIERLSGRIRHEVRRLLRQLKQVPDMPGARDLLLSLTRREPDYAPYYLQLARAQIALDEDEQARQSLLLIRQDALIGAEASRLLASLQVLDEAGTQAADNDTSDAAVSRVSLHRRGDHYLVDTRVGVGGTARLLIDTGASMTLLTAAAAARLEAQLQATGRSNRFNTANGVVSGPVVRADSLLVGDWRLDDVDIGVLELDSHDGIDGLLGMNFLRHFRFYIDQETSVLSLSPR